MDDLTIWREAKRVDLMKVGQSLANVFFNADPELIQVQFDFTDCDGEPFIWMHKPEEDAQSIHEYEFPEGADLTQAYYDLITLSQEMLQDYEGNFVKFFRE